ncbi:hypothetical protein [Brenneria tiliae]|uniref:hypothetical protein n=1 Tax=Brenneria tiliae TaxID=2914984 RepID=UPI002014CB3E|nr:hypothetical protein [Brenneria tiliae]MCL2895876.1 hypothetical protein [Brenneria tiliae]MCL2900416.1 hypothetical protein [Brenneria tiliae]
MKGDKKIYLFELDAITSPSNCFNANSYNAYNLDNRLMGGVSDILDGLDRDSWKIILSHTNGQKNSYSIKEESSETSHNFVYIDSNRELIDFVKINKEIKIILFTINYIEIIDELVSLGCKIIIIDKYDNLLQPKNCLYLNDYSTVKELLTCNNEVIYE